jgi:outer membrane protein insertion porin family
MARRARLIWIASVALFGAAPAVARAQEVECDPGDLEVRSLSFTGNKRFSDDQLDEFLVTTPSDWWRRTFRIPFLGKKRCLDQTELPRDVLRLGLLYRKHGFFRTQVQLETRQHGQQGVDVIFHMTEGDALRVDSLAIGWAEPVQDSARIVRGFRPRRGEPFDQVALDSSRRAIIQRLRDAGHPRADVLTSFTTDTSRLSATIDLQVVPGQLARIDSVRFVGDSLTARRAIPLRVVRRMLGLDRHDIYRERDLINAQRNLYQTDAFRHVEVRLAPDSIQPPGDSAVIIDVVAIEGNMHVVRAGLGYGTLDCFRAQGELTNRNFLRGARRLDLSGRVSKLGVASGTSWAKDNVLCRKAAQDTFSVNVPVNYYAAATYRQPTLFGLGPRSVPTLTLFSERRSEYKAYLRSTPIGALATIFREQTRVPLTFSYELSYGRTQSSPALFCAVFNYCAPDDYNFLNQKTLRLSAVGLTATRDRSNSLFNPTRGDRVNLEFRHASPAIGSDTLLQFNKLLGEASFYQRLGAAVFAARVRGGGVFGSRVSLSTASATYIPPQERFYAGGANTVRGYQQNELGPLVYVTSERTDVDAVPPFPPAVADTNYQIKPNALPRVVPIGGNSLFVANAELRLPDFFFPRLVQWSIFTDAGAVWNRGDGQSFRDRLRVTPGLGVRVLSFLGPIRMDVGYNRYDRTPGAVYYTPRSSAQLGKLLCASPGEDASGPTQAENCPTTFSPEQTGKFFSRLTYNFSIGQAF